MREETSSGPGAVTPRLKTGSRRRRLVGLMVAALWGASIIAPPAGRGQQEAVLVKDGDEVEITCSKALDQWEPIMTLGPVDAAEEEAALSKDIKVTLKYLFLQGSQRRRITLLVKWTQNATLALEVNPKLVCDTQGTAGVRTTVRGQTQVSDGKAVVPTGYIRILPEELD